MLIGALWKTRILEAGVLSDSNETLIWNYTVSSPGQIDIRIVIDGPEIIDEYDETNNAAYFVVTGADVSPSLVPSFAPSIGLVLDYWNHHISSPKTKQRLKRV